MSERGDGLLGAEPARGSAEVFLQELHDALTHLRDLPIRRSHPIGRHLSPAAPLSTAEIQRVLFDAIERLRPPVHVGADAARSRRYRYLTLRYVEGSRLEDVADELGISARQARREHRLALQELAALLLKSAAISLGPSLPPPVGSPPAPPLVLPAVSRLAAPAELEAELAQVETTRNELLDPRVAVEDALDLVSRFAASRSVAIESELSEELPPVVATRMVLRQILLNLLSYSISTARSDAVRITAAETTAGVEISFWSVPTGRRPPDAVPDRPAEDAVRSLEAASQLAESQEGSIRIEPTPDGPATVRLLLLTAQATLVLVVDDNPSLVRLFRRFVRGEGFRLVQARNGARAHQLARALRPDVIVMDLMMPVQDGWDLYRSLQHDAATAAIPVVACSILPERELALSLGAVDFLPKPVTPESLLAALQPFRRAPRPDRPPSGDGAARPGSP